MISTTDFFYPLVDDPYMQGKIGCANVLSDMYSFGVVNIDNVLMILAASTEMSKTDRDISTKFMIKGFNDLATEAGTMVTGGQTVLNPWPIIGGTATSICAKDEFIMPYSACVGDVLVLTKPLGTQVTVNVNQWKYNPEKWNRISHLITKEQATEAYEFAMLSMARLNKNAAILMHKYGAHGCTDVTGFGIMGHGNNLVKNQKKKLNFEIHTLPIIKFMKDIDNHVNIFKLLQGYSAETSGGLLVILPRENAELFCSELYAMDKFPAWIIGDVVPPEVDANVNNNSDTTGEIFNATNICTIVNNPKIIEVECATSL